MVSKWGVALMASPGEGKLKRPRPRLSKQVQEKQKGARFLGPPSMIASARHSSTSLRARSLDRGRNWHLAFAGCQGFTGPVPPPFWITRYGTDKDLVRERPRRAGEERYRHGSGDATPVVTGIVRWFRPGAAAVGYRVC